MFPSGLSKVIRRQCLRNGWNIFLTQHELIGKFTSYGILRERQRPGRRQDAKVMLLQFNFFNVIHTKAPISCLKENTSMPRGRRRRKEDMTQQTNILHEAKRLRLLAAALELQHFTRTEANLLPIPGGDRVIAIGTPAQVRALLAAGGDTVQHLTAAEHAFVELVRERPREKLDGGEAFDADGWALWKRPEALGLIQSVGSYKWVVSGLAPLTICAAGRDGECGHAQCPQLRDGEPRATGRHCPLDSEGGHHD